MRRVQSAPGGVYGADDETLAPSGRPITPAPAFDPEAETAEGPASGVPPAAAFDRPELPRSIGRFLILGELGAGGMGQVFAAYDPKLDRRVALKVVRGAPDHDGSAWRARLIREAQAMARLSHPHVVAVHEVDTDRDTDQLYVAMELIDGTNLAQWLCDAPRDWREILDKFLAAGEGLAAAHAAGLVHRDFKPSNVLVGADGRVRVADFGLVRARGEVDRGDLASNRLRDESLTQVGAMIGTPAYMAPEQVGGHLADERCDVFAFCVALWEALYGVRPFSADSSVDRLAAIKRGELGPPALDAGAPRWPQPHLRRGMSYEPADRWPDMRSLLAALARDPAAERARRRRAVLGAAAALLLGGLLVWGLSSLWTLARARAREADAQQRLDATTGRIAALRAEGRADEAAALFDAFVAAPEHQGTRALAQALRRRAEDTLLAGDEAGAVEAFARAYVAATDDEDSDAALLGLAGLFHERRAYVPLTWVLATLERRPSAARDRQAPLRLDAALYRRDVAAAEAIAAEATGDPGLARLVAMLGRGRPTEHRAEFGGLVDLEGDGAVEVLLLADTSPTARVVLARAAPDLPAVASFTLPELGLDALLPRPRTTPGPGHLVGWVHPGGSAGMVEGEAHLLAWQDDRLVPIAAWIDARPLAAVDGDLDGDGVAELYVGTGPTTRQLLRLDPRTSDPSVRSPSPRLDGTVSDILALALGDLDLDGRQELVVAAGPWRAYDLRVLRAEASGAPLRTVARRKLGVVHDVALVPLGDGPPLIAVAKGSEPLYAAERYFPDGDHTGAPPGLHLFRLDGDELRDVAFIPLEPEHRLFRLVVADLDGDGRPELLGRVDSLHETMGHLEVYRFADERRPTRHRVGGLVPLAAVEVDGDPASELVVMDWTQGKRVSLLGAGDTRIAPLDLGRPVVGAPPPDALAGDSFLRQHWLRADELAGLGLLAAASRRFAEIGHALAPGDARGQALVRAAELAAEAADPTRAAALFEEAARTSGHLGLLERAAATHERAGELADALRLLTELAAAGEVDPTLTAREGRWRALLADRREFAFDRPLTAAWQIRDPLALRHDRLRGVLLADLRADDPPLALPLALTGPDRTIRLDFALTDINYGGSFGVALHPTDDSPALLVTAYSTGSLQAGRLGLYVQHGDGLATSNIVDLPAPTQTLTLEIAELATLGELRVSLAIDGAPRITIRRPFAGRAGERATLELLRSAPLAGKTHDHGRSRLELRRLILHGLREDPPATADDPWDLAARALVEREPAAALAALDLAAAQARPAPPAALAWRAQALVDAGRWSDAAALLRGALAGRGPGDPLYRAVVRLLTTRVDTFAPVLREALGPAYPALFADTWFTPTLVNHKDPAVERALLEHLPDLADPGDGDLPPHAPPHAMLRAAFAAARAYTYARLGREQAAHRELAACDPTALAGSLHAETIHSEALLALAALDVADGRLEHALDHLEVAASRSRSRDVFADGIAVDPSLAPLRDHPRWAGLVAGDRD